MEVPQPDVEIRTEEGAATEGAVAAAAAAIAVEEDLTEGEEVEVEGAEATHPENRAGTAFGLREKCLLILQPHLSVFAPNVPATIDARLTDNSQDALVATLKRLTVSDNDFPLRPDFGKLGTPVKLRANFFPVKVSFRTLNLPDWRFSDIVIPQGAKACYV